MNVIQIQQLRKNLDELGTFVTKKGSEASFSEAEIIDWVSDCIVVFNQIGVDPVIIRNFLDHFRSRERIVISPAPSNKEMTIGVIGPFSQRISASGYSVGSEYWLTGSFYYAKVAFSAARAHLNDEISDRRLVPAWLIEEMEKYEGLQHLCSSLVLIEDCFEERDSNGLLTESTTLLDSFLKLDSELASKQKIGSRLNCLIENDSKRAAFGVSRDIVRGLNCGRLVRNEKVIHKDTPMKYDIPFIVAVSYAYLVLFFVECVILNGDLFKRDSGSVF